MTTHLPFPIVVRGARLLASTLFALTAAVTAPAQFTQDDAIHITNRIGFGGNALDRAAVMSNYAAFLNAQLDPSTIPDPDIDLMFPAGTYSATLEELQREQFIRAMVSNRRLQEVMTYFWERHFNTNHTKVVGRVQAKTGMPFGLALLQGTRLEAQMAESYRTFGLSTFYHLLVLTTMHASMMMYLDNDQNRGCAGNENYARELLELYSMGPTNESTGLANYSQPDIVSAAGCLSGWDLTFNGWNGVLNFTSGNHCMATPTLLTPPNQITISLVGTGSNQMFELVGKIAASPLTQDFICRKLMRYFLSDAGGSTTLLNAMKAVWGTQGDIRAVLNVLLSSAEFTGTTHRWQRVSTPFERIVWWQRVWGTSLLRSDTFTVDLSKADVLRDTAALMGEELFLYPSPDGYPIESDEQISAANAVTTWDYAAMLHSRIGIAPNFYANHPTVVLALLTAPQTSPTTIATTLLTTLYGSNFTGADLQQVIDAIQFDPFGAIQPPLNLSNPVDYGTRLALGAATAGAFVQGHLK